MAYITINKSELELGSYGHALANYVQRNAKNIDIVCMCMHAWLYAATKLLAIYA